MRISPGSMILKILSRLCLAVFAAWATLAIYYSNLPSFLRTPAALVFAAAGITFFVLSWRRRYTKTALLAACAGVLVLWLNIPPSNSRNWQPDVAALPWADIQGTSVTLHNIRN